MAEQGGQEKTEAPTPKKREDSRKDGMVAMSREAGSAAIMATFVLYFLLLGKATMAEMMDIWNYSFSNIIQPDLNIFTLWAFTVKQIWVIGSALLLLFGLLMAVGLLVAVLQVGFMMNPPKFQASRLNPLEGIKRIFSASGLAELMKSLFKMIVIGYITYVTLAEDLNEMLSLSKLPLFDVLSFNFNMLINLFARVSLALVILALFDYLFQRWNTDQKLMMTKQEVKEELKQTEGDPQLRARIRQIQREMSRARMMESVPQADVVVTNPTHFAVALIYDREAMGAPQLVAKGADHLAHRIRTVAGENDVPIVENPPLARELYANVEIGDEIPEKFFRAVAEVLAYVYRIKGKTAELSSGQSAQASDSEGTETPPV